MRLALRLLLTLLLATPAAADEQVLQAQKLLNRLGLEAGPEDGDWGPRTAAALARWRAHRHLPDADGITPADLADLAGHPPQALPEAEGLDLHPAGGRFPEADSLTLDPDDPTAFTLRLAPDAYDPAELRHRSDMATYHRILSLARQRAALESGVFPAGARYELSFEVRASGPAAGSLFRVHRSGYEGFASLDAFDGSLRFSAGPAARDVSLLRGDWPGTWHRVHMVLTPSWRDDSRYQITLDDGLPVTLEGRPMLDFEGGFHLAFGPLRGHNDHPAEASYRNIRFQPLPDSAPDPAAEAAFAP